MNQLEVVGGFRKLIDTILIDNYPVRQANFPALERLGVLDRFNDVQKWSLNVCWLKILQCKKYTSIGFLASFLCIFDANFHDVYARYCIFRIQRT